jgi:type I restriction enzyme S subunit
VSARDNVLLGDITEIVMGQAPPGTDCNKDGRGTVFVKAGEFDDRHPVVREWTTNPLKLARIGDVLVCVVGATAGKVNESIDCAIGRSVAAVRPNAARLLSPYLYHFLATQVFRLRTKSQGLAQGVITREMLQEILIPLPSLPEQRWVAEILDRADALRAKRRDALAELDTLIQSIFLDMFGDPATNPKGWPRRAIKDLGKVTTGGTPPSAKSGMFDGPIPFITPGDLENDAPVKRSVTEAGAEESVTVRPGATLVCCIGATIGKIGMAPVRSAFNQQINAVEWNDEVNDSFGLSVLRFFKPTIIAWGASTTLPILKKTAFERIEVPVPPVELQKAFAQRLSLVGRIGDSSRASLVSLNELFAALQSRAFRREL